MTAIHADAAIADYDSSAYDYRTFWQGRDYEQWAESTVLARALRRLPVADWFADFGGGYGRNLDHCRARNTVLVDYSVNNLTTAAHTRTAALADGSLHLVRADLGALPFRDGAFDASMTIRVLHHLRDADAALHEMLRTVRGCALVDVPIKHHVLARCRAIAAGELATLRGPAPRVVGQSSHPFSEFQLAAVRAAVDRAGFDSTLVASVNNLRRWDQGRSERTVRALTPLAHGAERVLQRGGRGWWGPNQFLLARRRTAAAAPPAPRASTPPLSASLAAFAVRVCCPACRSELSWTPDTAACTACDRAYHRTGPFWDFTH